MIGRGASLAALMLVPFTKPSANPTSSICTHRPLMLIGLFGILLWNPQLQVELDILIDLDLMREVQIQACPSVQPTSGNTQYVL